MTGNKADELLASGKTVIFAFEEAIGFMWGSEVLDKDGISAGVHMATMAAYLNHHDITLLEHLEVIYAKYGYHVSYNSYFICNKKEKIAEIFHRLRNFTEPNTVSNRDESWNAMSCKKLLKCCHNVFNKLVHLLVPPKYYEREVRDKRCTGLNHRIR